MKYKCSNCGKVIDEIEYMNDIENGSMGMCFCEYDQELLNPYIKIMDDLIIIDNDLEIVYVIGMGNQCFYQIAINSYTGENYVNISPD